MRCPVRTTNFLAGSQSQGDQIRRIFACRAVVFFFENDKSSVISWASFFHGTSYVFILTKNVLGYILGDFFTNSSGHPAQR
jgi:hypothetical protein